MKGPLTVEVVQAFLEAVDASFPVPLSEKQNLTAYAHKLVSSATLCAEVQDGQVRSLVAGYTENLTNDLAYIAVVATRQDAKGQGLASTCVKAFLDRCREKNISAVHLYTDPTNEPAKAMYQKLGFVLYVPEQEPRPLDTHLIYRIEKEK